MTTRSIGSLGNDLICGGPGADLIHGGRGNDEIDGGGGDADQGDRRPRRRQGRLGGRRRPATRSAGEPRHRHRQRRRRRPRPGPRRLRLGPDVRRRRARATSPPSRPRSRAGNGHRRLGLAAPSTPPAATATTSCSASRAIEGSAFRDTLIGNGQANVIDGGLGDDKLIGGGGPTPSTGDQGSDRCKRRRRAARVSCGKETSAEGLRLRPARPAGRRRRRPADRRRRRPRRLRRRLRRNRPTPSAVTAQQAAGDRARAACQPPRRYPGAELSGAGGPGLWLMADLGPGNDSLRVEGSLLAVGSVPPRRRLRQRRRSTAAPRTT